MGEEEGGDEDMPAVLILTEDNDDSSETSVETEASVKSSEHFPNDGVYPKGKMIQQLNQMTTKISRRKMNWLKRKINNQMRHHLHSRDDLV